MRIEAEHTAALVIDYQEKLVPVMHEKENLICQSDILLRGLNVLGIPMFLTQQYTKGLGETVNEITTAAGTEEYVEKISFSAYERCKRKIRDKNILSSAGLRHIFVYFRR